MNKIKGWKIIFGSIVVGLIIIAYIFWWLGEWTKREEKVQNLGTEFCQSKNMSYLDGGYCNGVHSTTKILCKDENGEAFKFNYACR